MKIMKKYLLLASALAVMVGCADDSIVNNGIETPINGELRPITFGSYTAATTRADFEGSAAAGKLGNNFVVEGMKGNGSAYTTSDAPVFDHYNVNWVNNTANTTTSNTNDWEYVGQAKHAFGPTGNQVIKYWDYAKSQYDFIAYSKGTAAAVYATADYTAGTNVLFTEITPATMTSSTGGAYTVKGRAADLAKVYIADMVTAYRDATPSDYQNVVQFKFRSLSAKVRIALYEIVPGYSVRNVVFYTNATTAATDGKAHLFTTGTDVFNEEGTYTVYYPTTGYANSPNGSTPNTDYNKAHLSFAAETSGTATVKEFGAMDLTNTAQDKEVAEAAGKVYLGRASNEATYAGDNAKNHYTVVIPNETGAALHLKVNYTLVSTDGSGEVINVTGATAVVPKEYSTWKSGYAYTYIFKISQNGNGKTNPSVGPEGLYPITFDAVVMNDEVDGIQETITTVAEPSITTYAKGAVVTANNEYKTGNNIYVMVNKDGSNVALETTTGTINAKLYTVTLEDTDGSDAITEAAQTINEASIANALAQGGTVIDANKFKMTVTAATGLSNAAQIAAADSPDGNAITINGAKFTPAAVTYTAETPAGTEDPSAEGWYEESGGVYTLSIDATVGSGKTYYTKSSGAATYVFEFIDTDSKKYYKIIKVVE